MNPRAKVYNIFIQHWISQLDYCSILLKNKKDFRAQEVSTEPFHVDTIM